MHPLNKYRAIFFGTPEFSVPTLKALLTNPEFEVVAVVSQPDKASGRGKKVVYSPVKQLALEYNLPILQHENIKKNQAEFIKELEQVAPIDISVVIAFGQILPEAILNFPKHTSVNLHASLLPKYRGAAPIQRAIWNGEEKTGVCLMQMDVAMDTGAVYSSREITVQTTDNAGSLHDKLSLISAEIIQTDLIKVLRGELKPVPQNHSLATYAAKIKSDEEKINWNNTAKEILQQIKALSPYPGAHTKIRDLPCKISEAEIIMEKHNINPGGIAYQDKSSLYIATGDFCIAVIRIKPAGKKEMGIKDFLNGIKCQ